MEEQQIKKDCFASLLTFNRGKVQLLFGCLLLYLSLSLPLVSVWACDLAADMWDL